MQAYRDSQCQTIVTCLTVQRTLAESTSEFQPTTCVEEDEQKAGEFPRKRESAGRRAGFGRRAQHLRWPRDRVRSGRKNHPVFGGRSLGFAPRQWENSLDGV